MCNVTFCIAAWSLSLTSGLTTSQPTPSQEQVDALIKAGDAKKLRALGDKAVPFLVERFQNSDEHRKFVLPLLIDSRDPNAIKGLENFLRKKGISSDELWMTARALGMMKHKDSKKAILDKLRDFTAPEPNRLGVMLGGSNDGSHFMLIWAMSRIEGKDFGGLPKNHTSEDVFRLDMSAEQLDECLRWWMDARKALEKAEEKKQKDK